MILRGTPSYVLASRDIPQAPLAKAVAERRFTLHGVDDPTAVVTPWQLSAFREPHLIAMVANERPDVTGSAINVRNWCRFAIVHARRERRDDYEVMVDLVLQHRRVVLVETVPALADRWVRFFANVPARSFLIDQVPV